MAKHNAKTKKEDIVVDKKFFMSIVKKVDDTARDVENIKAMQEVEAEISKYESKEPNMTQILPLKPKFEITVDFPASYTMQMVKERGFQFHKELERLIANYQITSIKITTH